MYQSPSFLVWWIDVDGHDVLLGSLLQRNYCLKRKRFFTFNLTTDSWTLLISLYVYALLIFCIKSKN